MIVTEQPPASKPKGLFSSLRARLMGHKDSQPATTGTPCAQCAQKQQGCAQCAQQHQQQACTQCGQQPIVPVTYVAYPMHQPTQTTHEPPLAKTVVTKPVVEPVVAKVATPEVEKQFQNKIGAADDFTWITGELFYAHVDGGKWVLRYAAVDTEDKYGGSVVLAPAVDMKNYREGDLVSVNGEILNDSRSSRHLGGALYRADSITMIERTDK
jgi:hypothetical protein